MTARVFRAAAADTETAGHAAAGIAAPGATRVCAAAVAMYAPMFGAGAALTGAGIFLAPSPGIDQ